MPIRVINEREHRNIDMPKIPATKEGLLIEEPKAVVFLKATLSTHFTTEFIVGVQLLSLNNVN